MPHALPSNTRKSHFHAATIAHDPTMLDAFVLPARTFPILHGPKNTFAKQSALFRLERAVIDRFRVLYFALRPGADGIGRRNGDRDVVNEVYLIQPEHFSGGFFRISHTFMRFGETSLSIN